MSSKLIMAYVEDEEKQRKAAKKNKGRQTNFWKEKRRQRSETA